MSDDAHEPRPEEYGVTADELTAVPRPFLARHTCAVVVSLYLIAVAVALGALFQLTHSVVASAFFAVVLLAAASIVLLPLVICLVCGLERAEEGWLCRRFPAYRACQAFREAWARWHEERARVGQHPPGPPVGIPADPLAFRALVLVRLEELGWRLLEAAEVTVDGFDARLSRGAETLLLRIDTGPDPVPVAVGRELFACLQEQAAQRALMVSRAGDSPALAAYAQDRPLLLATPATLETVLDSPPAP